MCQWPRVQPTSTGVLALGSLYSSMLCGLVLTDKLIYSYSIYTILYEYVNICQF